jgi:hypothetical protein
MQVEYFDIHTMAQKKYLLLNKDMPIFEKSSDTTKARVRNIFSNIPVKSIYLKL